MITYSTMKTFKLSLFLCFLNLVINSSQAQQTENVILITLDGLRWQELFTGADSLLVDDSGYVGNPEALVEEYWRTDPLERREILMPFFWQTIVNHGQIYGNRKFGNKVNCVNKLWFSYPGYSEILTGKADDERITSNSKTNNPNVTVLEYVNNEKRFAGKVAAFGSWDVFPYIINEERSGIPVNAGYEAQEDNPTESEQVTNRLMKEVYGPWRTVRMDPFTHQLALAHLKNKKPRLLYISYGETDDWAHEGEYDHYLHSATQTDGFIKEIWDYVQSESQYKNKTTLIITTDHGRGTHPKDTWRNHGASVPNGGEIWLAIMGPEFDADGEMKSNDQRYQNQVASTIAKLLGVKIADPEIGKPLY